MARQIAETTFASDGIAPLGAGLSDRIGALAHCARRAARAKGCLIGYRARLESNCVWAADGLSHDIADERIAEVLGPRAQTDGRCSAIRYLTPCDAAVLRSAGVEVEDSARVALFCLRQDCGAVWVAVVAAPVGESAIAVAELAARSTCALLEYNQRSQQACFWKTQAGELRDRLLAARAELTRFAQQHAKDVAVKRRLAAHAQRGNFRELAFGLSRLGPFQGWIIAAQAHQGLQIADNYRIGPHALREAGGDLIRGLRRLLASAAQSPARAAKSSRRELERQRALTRRLLQGLFATADAERASLRRDLHDDWAQLLAAAQIAINGDGRSAQKFFSKLEGKLRERLDALRPPRSRRIGFKRAIMGELYRLEQAGIHATVKIHGLRRIPASIREILIRVVAEGVSNVILHSGADRVHIEVQGRDAIACVVVSDNGRGASHREHGTGSGLRGLSERVAVMGGNCMLESKPGCTVLRAEIPVAEL